MSASADSIAAGFNAGANWDSTVDYGEPSPRSSGSYSSRDSRKHFIRPTPERGVKILQRLLHDKMHDVYEIPEVFDKHIRTVIEKFCKVSVEAQGSLEALSEDNIDVFIQAMEEHRDPNIIKPKHMKPVQQEIFHLEIEPDVQVHSSSVETVSSLSFALSSMDLEIVPDADVEPGTSMQSISSLSSITSNDSDVTKSVKKVKKWKKGNSERSPRSFTPGVMWRPTDISPQRVEASGLYVVKEHVLEEHIAAFETAIDKHEVDLVNEMRFMQGKPLIDNKSCVVVNDKVYTTGGPAIFPCIMETHEGKKYVSVFIHVNKSCRGHCHNIKTFMVECVCTGAIIMKIAVEELRFWKELCTATICMQFREEKKKAMAPTSFLHFEDISHCRLFATELSDRECLC